MLMLYVNDVVIIYVIKMQLKHVTIFNLIIGCYYCCGNGR